MQIYLENFSGKYAVEHINIIMSILISIIKRILKYIKKIVKLL